MPIIIDNFHVNTNVPIDNRFVVGGTDSFYSNRDAIQYKYQGLRIWDLTPNNSGPYYWTGVTWSSENAVGVSVDGTTLPGYLPVFTQGPTVLGKSIIYQNPASNQIGIGLIGNSIEANVPSGPSLVNGLHVAGNIRTNAYFVGSGLHVTDINASNINSGLLAVSRISHLSISGALAPGEYVLFNDGTSSSVRWRATSGLSVLNSTNTTNVNISENSSSTFHYITFVNATSGQLPLRINSSKMQFRPNTGQLFLSDGSPTDPVYSFLSNLSTGFYYSYSGNGNAVPSTIQGIGTSINGVEITRTNQNGLIVNNRIYIPTASNNTDVGYGIVWSTNGNSTNDTVINDGFVYNGKRLNLYGIGSHTPTEVTIPNVNNAFGTYIAGYFGVDIFSGGRLKVKVSELNDVTINSRLNINLTETNYTLASSTNASLVLSTMANRGGSAGNIVVIKDWSVRAPNTQPGDENGWLTWKHHNGITVDNVWATPNGPDTGQVTASGTLTFWERHPYLHEQYFGSVDRKTLTIHSGSQLSQFVKVNGNLLVGTNTISPSAVADFTSTNKGIIPPRLTTTQRGTISSPVAGLTIYNTTTKHMEVYDGATWVGLSTTKVDYGTVVTTNRYSQAGWNGYGDSSRNYGFVSPPTGYTVLDLVGFIPSIAFIDFSGAVDGNDFLYCNYSVESTQNRVRVWCQNSENHSESIIKYIAIYQK